LQNYRYWVLYLCPEVRFLDFQKVKQRERVKAAELFGTKSEPSELAKKLLTHKSRTTLDAATSYTNGASSAPRQDRVRLTDTEKKRVEELIRNAKSLKEIERLEKMLNEGRIPGGGDTEMSGV
jgi:U2 small nuclear ribonucleoprotein A'